jgi:hypothetical protein
MGRFRLGDAIEKALTKVGITKEKVETWLGRPCGCNERKEKLNRLSDWVMRTIKSETKEEQGTQGETERVKREMEEALNQPVSQRVIRPAVHPTPTNPLPNEEETSRFPGGKYQSEQQAAEKASESSDQPSVTAGRSVQPSRPVQPPRKDPLAWLANLHRKEG